MAAEERDVKKVVSDTILVTKIWGWGNGPECFMFTDPQHASADRVLIRQTVSRHEILREGSFDRAGGGGALACDSNDEGKYLLFL